MENANLCNELLKQKNHVQKTRPEAAKAGLSVSVRSQTSTYCRFHLAIDSFSFLVLKNTVSVVKN